MELVAKSPVKRLKLRAEDAPEKPTLTEAQLVELFALVSIRYKAFFLTLALTGVRTGEALGLKWSDLDFATHKLQIRRAIYRGQEATPKIKKSVRDRPMAPQLYQALLNHKVLALYRKPEDFVFASSTGRPFNPDQLREALQDALKKMGVTFDQKRAYGMHLLRHSSGSIVARSTKNVKATQEWLGHSNSRVTLDTYTHLAADQPQKTAEQLENAIFAQPEVPGLMH